MKKIFEWDQGNQLVLVAGVDSNEGQNESLNIGGWKAYLYKGNLRLFNGNIVKEYSCSNGFSDDLIIGDILTVSNTGNVTVYYKSGTKEIDVFITNHCNSNCVMCPLSESVRRKKNGSYLEWNKEYIKLLPEYIGYINVTGGEPTLMKDEFMEVMKVLADKFRWSSFQLLSNGRSFADREFLKTTLYYSPKEMRFAIPLHSSDSSIHDAITQSKGSFSQTNAGIKNLLAEKQKVEVRIVVSKTNLDCLVDTAQYIKENYIGVFCVTFIAMEMMGNAIVNRNTLWVDYDEVFQRARPAIDLLVESGIDVQLFNFPLCAVDRGYWHIAAKSITEHKIRYMKECDLCTVKKICGGFFFSTKQVMDPKVCPVKDEYEA